MYLVIIKWFSNISDTICIVTEMEGKEYSGMGIHKIIPVKLYQ